MGTAASEFVVALDLGSARCRCLIAEVTDGGVRVIGRGEEPSRGVRRGEVIEIPAARYAAERAVRQAEEDAGVVVESLFLAAGSRHVRSANSRACVGITREEHTVSKKDVHRVLAAARRAPPREDTVVIDTRVCSYAVDDVRHVRAPEGMHGTRLEAEVHILSDARSAVENLSSCVDPEKHAIEQTVFGPYAAAEAVLEEDEKKLGVALVDIGAGTAGFMLFRDHAPVFSSVVPMGGDHITNDIAVGLEIGVGDAARLKEEHATLDPTHVGHPITFRRVTRPGAYCAEPRRLFAVVECRVREMLDVVRRELMRAAVRPATIRVVLTGGTSRLPGLATLAERVVGCPVRVGRPKLGGTSLGPEMATAVGTLLVGAATRSRPAPPVGASNPAEKVLNWLRQFF